MDFIRKSLSTKAVLLLLASGLAVGVSDYFAVPYLKPEIQAYTHLGLIGLIALLAICIVVIGVHLPLAVIFDEMKALLTGHQYKKIFTKRIDEIGVLAHFFNEVTKNIEHISTVVAEGKRLSQELEISSDIQHRILPKTLPQVSGLSIYGNTRPASEVGGDSFDVMPAGNNAFIYVGDVTGHGLPAALIMVMVNTILRTYSEIYSSGYDVIVNTNRILKQRIEPRRFMTCVLLRWNSQERKMYYTGAGHEHILVFHKNTNACEVHQTGGIALGMVADISKIVKEEVIPTEQGDYVILYSDGLTEAKDIHGEMFGIARLKAAVEKYASFSVPEELFTNISKEFAAFVGEQMQEDDITLMMAQRT